MTITGEMVLAAAEAIANVRFLGAIPYERLSTGEQVAIMDEAAAALKAALA